MDGYARGVAVARGHWEMRAFEPTLLFRLVGALLLGLLSPENQMRVRKHRWMRRHVGTRTWENLVTNEGLDHSLDATLAAGTQITSWFLGLIDDSPTVAAGDTLASHAGWTEVTAYDEAARQAWTAGSVSGQSVDNNGSQATFTISTDSTNIGGAFLASDNTKGGTTGTLYAAGAFTGGDLVLNDGATLDVLATFTQEQAA